MEDVKIEDGEFGGSFSYINAMWHLVKGYGWQGVRFGFCEFVYLNGISDQVRGLLVYLIFFLLGSWGRGNYTGIG